MSRRDGSTTKVFVGSLPPTVTTDDLRKLFAPYGNIVECDIANRCGFLHLEDQELALKAIEELNNTSFMGGTISVERGRVKPPRRSREGEAGGAAIRGRERAGPYARTDAYGRLPPPRNGVPGGYGGVRDYDDYGARYGEYDRAIPMRSYPLEYDTMADRRPMYDDRRGYPPPNGYDRRPYDDRGGYLDERSAYDDRRLPPSSSSYESRRPMMTDRRPMGDQGERSLMTTYDRSSAGSEIYSRRGDLGPKQSLPPPSDPYGNSSLGYGGGATSGGYSSSSNVGYGSSGGSAYNSSADHYGSSGGYGSGYNDNRTPSSGYSNATGGSYAGGSGSYSTPASAAGYGDSYSSSRGSYDTAYSAAAPPRGFASSSAGPGLRSGGDLPPSGGRRF